MQITFANGQVREFHPDKQRLCTVVRPDVNRGTPPRNMSWRDYISVPVISTRGEWNLGDMLSIDSIGNLFTAYNYAEAKQMQQARTERAHKKAHRA